MAGRRAQESIQFEEVLPEQMHDAQWREAHVLDVLFRIERGERVIGSEELGNVLGQGREILRVFFVEDRVQL
jgi:hypothetical protein